MLDHFVPTFIRSSASSTFLKVNHLTSSHMYIRTSPFNIIKPFRSNLSHLIIGDATLISF